MAFSSSGGIFWVECSLCGQSSLQKECQGRSRRQLQAESGKQRKEPLVGSGSRGMRKAEGLAPTSWRVAHRLMNVLNRTLNLNLISSAHEWASIVEKHVKLVDWASSVHI